MSEQRYSDKRMSEDFTAYVLFSEPLEGTFGEIIAAAAEDYAGLDWDHQALGPDRINTRGVTLCVDFGSESPTRGSVKMIGVPGPCDVSWDDTYLKNRLVFPHAKDVVGRHTDHLSISVSSARGDGSAETLFARRFDAVRKLTCLVAVLAKLPITTAVYFPNGDTLLPPSVWEKAAEDAMKGEIPLLGWINFVVNAFDEPPEPLPITVSTIGLAAFNGHEIIMPRMRMLWPKAMEFAHVTTRMLIEGDHTFADSNTLGHEAGKPEFRIRHAAEGRQLRFPDGIHRPQTDQWWLFHETCDLDDIDIFGPRTGKPPPPGYDNSIHGDMDRLKKSLYRFHAGS